MPLPTAVMTLVTSLASATAAPEVETLPAPAAARHTIPPPGPSSDPAEDDTLLHLSEHICYSVVVPTICACGVLGNTLNLLVLTRGRREMKQSIYVYLLILAVSDLMTCLLLLFAGVARGVASDRFWWQAFDVYLHLPLASVSTTVSILTIVMVTIERIVLIRNCSCANTYCTRPTAWRVGCVIVLVSIIFNIPYYMGFRVHPNDGIQKTWLYESRYYQAHNWARFVVLGVGAAAFLACGNLLLVVSLRGAAQRRRTLISQQRHREERRLKEETRLTATLVGIIIMFLLGEFPTHLASRQSAGTLIFAEDDAQLDSLGFRTFKLVASILMAFHYSCNFVLYCILNSHFLSLASGVLHCRRAPPGGDQSEQ